MDFNMGEVPGNLTIGPRKIHDPEVRYCLSMGKPMVLCRMGYPPKT